MRWNPNPESFTVSKLPLSDEMQKSYDDSRYDWSPSTGGVLRLTKSSLFGYHFCPYQYWLEKFQGHRSEETMWMVRGSNVHDVVEYFWKNVDPILDEVLALIEDYKENLAYKKLQSIIPKPPAPYEYGEDSVIETWLRWQWDRLIVTKGKNWKPVGNELEVHARTNVEVDGVIVPVHMKGFVDRVFQDGDDGFILMELKTGKWTPKKATSMRQEMQFYKMLMEEGESEFLPVTNWAWEFPSGEVNNGDRREWEIEQIGERKTRYAPKSVDKKIKALIRAHLKEEFEPIHKVDCKSYCRHENLCSWCDYMHICPGWTQGGNKNE
jgi:hypothetical protein